MLSTVVIDALIRSCDGYTHLERLGYIMVGNTCIPYALAMICFYFAGQHYVDFRKCLYHCKGATLDFINLDDYMDVTVIKRNTLKVQFTRPAAEGKESLAIDETIK